MKLSYYGHSCFAVEIKGKKLLFDPFITPNELAKDVDPEKVEADYILVSHGHQDHMADAMDIAKRTNAPIISNFEIVTWFGEQGIEDTIPMNHGGAIGLDFCKIKYVNAIHSSVLPDGTYGGNPGGFIIMSDDTNFYYAGDTALTLDMQLIPRFAKLDLAILPIGDCLTMGIEDAITCCDFIQCDKVMGVHYDTFPNIRIDHQKAIETFKNAGKELQLLEIGKSADF
ncbi:L-ascorbate metabolism protein UlaG (beta-lactamase superfamily) [Catalinimonas alkaloidigena]|uniref:metal-dependent hydrolase n=1 Tax=Catalinimonas alkaloidigena TaxID=1075417 RepID=UPI002406608D|nr:metal-dependent hydrolase [Catalinimonas alkaloidigena]MDF9797325.1 L-ascorbate metabolism protein UlaG (beta-lactamase superfamily) [Catalinimonas alkaloidigena]